MKEGVEAALTQPSTYLKIQLNGGEITQYKQLNMSDSSVCTSLKTLYTQKNQLQHKLSTPALQNTRCSGWSDPQLTSWREGPTKETPNNNQNPKIYREPT